MPITKARGKKGKLPPFVPLLWEALNSKAYKELPASSAKALPYFIGKVKLSPRDPCYYTENVRFPYREAKVLGFSSGTFSNIIQNLMRYGFIDPVERGGMKPFGYGSSIFKLSPRWKDYGKHEFQKVEWFQVPPKLKSSPTPKNEMHSIKNRKNGGNNGRTISGNEAVHG